MTVGWQEWRHTGIPSHILIQTVTGTVSRVSASVFQLSNRPGWLNWSKYAEQKVPVAVGDRIQADLDSRGFVREVEKEEGK